MRQPILEAIETLNSYGLEVTSGIILGLDTDTAETPDRLHRLHRRRHIPMLTINLLQALPKTPLWDRLAEGRPIATTRRCESNVRFLRPYDEVLGDGRAHRPRQRSGAACSRASAPGRRDLRTGSARRGKLNWSNLSGVVLPSAWSSGSASCRITEAVLAARRATHAARPDRRGARMGFIAHHLIQFTREALRGEQNASYYSTKVRRLRPCACEAGKNSQPMRRRRQLWLIDSQDALALEPALPFHARWHALSAPRHGFVQHQHLADSLRVTRPTRRPSASITATAGADFSCRMRNALVGGRR